MGISYHSLNGRTINRTWPDAIELLKICRRTNIDWAEIGALIELSAQGTDITSDLPHENYRTRAVKK